MGWSADNYAATHVGDYLAQKLHQNINRLWNSQNRQHEHKEETSNTDAGHGFRVIRWSRKHKKPFVFKAARIVPPIKKLLIADTVITSAQGTQTMNFLFGSFAAGVPTTIWNLNKSQLDGLQAYNANQEARLFIENLQFTFEIVNGTTIPIQFDLVCATPRSGHSSTQSTTLTIQNGLQRKFGTPTGVLTFPFMTEQSSTDYKSEWKTLKKFHLKMSPGEVVKIVSFVQINKIYTTAMQEDSSSYFPGISHEWWYTLKGSPTLNGLNPSTKCSIGAAEVGMVLSSCLKYRFPIFGQNTFNYTTQYAISTFAGEKTMEEDTGAPVLNQIV